MMVSDFQCSISLKLSVNEGWRKVKQISDFPRGHNSITLPGAATKRAMIEQVFKLATVVAS